MPWRRAVLVLAVVFIPVGLLTWPWEFLPFTWQYGRVRDASTIIREVERIRQATGRLPTEDELYARLPALGETDDYGYAPQGQYYLLSAVHSFDWKIVYDSRTGRWSREP